MEENFGFISLNDRTEELEKEVQYHLARALRTQGSGKEYFRPNFRVEKKYTHITYPDFKPTEKREQREWELEEIRRCKNGYDGLTGKYYYYFNHVRIKDKEKGKIRPDFRAIDLDYFRFLEEVEKEVGKGLVCIKRRQVGMSWKASADALYDCSFNNDFEVGMNSKSETDSRNLFKKIKYIHQNLPDFLKPIATASDRRDFYEFAKNIKDDFGNKKKTGTQSTILSVAPTPTGHAGNQYRKLIMDELGETLEAEAIFSNAEDCLMRETRRVGTFIGFGTTGDTNKQGKAIIEFWKNHTTYNFDRFAFWGYNGMIMDEFGNDDLENSIRWVIYRRKKLESGSEKIYNKFKQKYPLNEEDAFLDTSGAGVGNSMNLSKRYYQLQSEPAHEERGMMRPRPDGGVDFVPMPFGKVIVYERPQNLINGYVTACLPPGEKVMTDSGLKNIEEVCSSDKLINETGQQVDIKKFLKFNVEDSEIFKIKLANSYRTTTFTEEHPILVSPHVRRRDYSEWRTTTRAGRGYYDFNFKYTPAKNVKTGDWVKIPNIYKKEIPVDLSLWDISDIRIDYQINNPLNYPDFWWFLGLLIGDGYCNPDGNIRITFNSVEEAHVRRLSNTVLKLFNRQVSTVYNGNCIIASFNCKQLSLFILKHFGRYSDGKKLPEWCKYMNKNCKEQLVLGYLDSDGCIRVTNRSGRGLEYTSEFVSINLELLESFQDILFSLGIVSFLSKLRDESIHFINNKYSNTKKCYRLRLAHHDTVELAKQINDTRSLKLSKIDLNNLPKKRKRPDVVNFLSEDKEYIYFRIKEITSKLYTGIVYNFECDTNTFLCHHITTHNCDPAEDDDVEKTRDTSNLSLCVMKKPFGPEPKKMVLAYEDRPKKLDEFYEQVAMIAKWYNCKVMIEMNKGGWRMKDYFEIKYPELLQLTPKSAMSAKGGFEMKHGVKMTADKKFQMMGLIDEYTDSEENCKFIPSMRLIDQFKVFGGKGADDDLAVAFGWGLILVQADKTVAKHREQMSKSTPDFGFKKEGKQIFRTVGKDIFKGIKKHKSALFK